jgi:hypothetical protein
VPARRILLAAAVMLLLAALLSSLSPREDQAVAPSRTEADAAAAEPPRVAKGRLPADEVVRAREGDIVELEVAGDRPDEARIDELGISGLTEPGLPARLRFVADRTGRFEVTLRDAGERVGYLQIGPPR